MYDPVQSFGGRRFLNRAQPLMGVTLHATAKPPTCWAHASIIGSFTVTVHFTSASATGEEG